MSNTKEYQNFTLKVKINKKLKHSYIIIDADKKVSIKTPYSSQLFIDLLLEEKQVWIEKKLQQMKNIKKLDDEELYSVDYIKDRVYYYAKEMKLEYTVLKFRKMKSRWGSCSSQGVITLNLLLTRVKKELIDYVIVHELAHLVYMNHSKNFHQLIENYLKNSKFYRRELKNISLTL